MTTPVRFSDANEGDDDLEGAIFGMNPEAPAAHSHPVPKPIPLVDDLPDDGTSQVRLPERSVEPIGIRPAEPVDEELDPRLYLPSPEGWIAEIKNDSAKQYCYQKNPGEDGFHLIVTGEIYLSNGTEKYCLRCALRTGLITSDRLYWQRYNRKAQQASLRSSFGTPGASP